MRRYLLAVREVCLPALRRRGSAPCASLPVLTVAIVALAPGTADAQSPAPALRLSMRGAVRRAVASS